MTNHTKELFEKYIKRTITNPEFKRLKENISSLDNEELASYIESYWNEYYNIHTYDNFDFNTLTKRLIGNKKSAPFTKSLNWILKAAAILLLPILMAVVGFYYMKNQQLSEHIAQQLLVVVESGEHAYLTLPDGTQVKMNAASSITYPSAFGFKNRKITLTGEAYLMVVEDTLHPFYVETSHLQIKVLGTIFNVNTYEDFDTVETTLLEGSIQITTKKGRPQTRLLQPNEKAIFNKRTEKLEVISTDARHETAWINGELLFRSTTFDEMINRLARYYGFKINIIGSNNYTERFTGSFQEENISNVLDLLKLNYDFDYTIWNNEITIIFR